MAERLERIPHKNEYGGSNPPVSTKVLLRRREVATCQSHKLEIVCANQTAATILCPVRIEALPWFYIPEKADRYRHRVPFL